MRHIMKSIVVKCAHRTDKMYRYVAITVFVFVVQQKGVSAPPPLRLTIDCGSDEDLTSSEDPHFKSSSSLFSDGFNVNTFCRLIHNSIPKAVKDGKFIVKQAPDFDQIPFGDTLIPVALPPPQGFPIKKLDLSRLKFPRVRVPNKIGVPRLLHLSRAKDPPILGHTMSIPRFKEPEVEETSAERMEKFKKGVQKMLHVVKILGQVDQYLSERARIIVDKLSKTFAE